MSERLYALIKGGSRTHVGGVTTAAGELPLDAFFGEFPAAVRTPTGANLEHDFRWRARVGRVESGAQSRPRLFC